MLAALKRGSFFCPVEEFVYFIRVLRQHNTHYRLPARFPFVFEFVILRIREEIAGSATAVVQGDAKLKTVGERENAIRRNKLAPK